MYRPHSEHAVRGERLVAAPQPFGSVEPTIALLGQTLRTIVYIEQDDVVESLRCLNHPAHVDGVNRDTRVVQGITREQTELAVIQDTTAGKSSATSI